VQEKEALLVIAELLDVVSVLCQNSGLTDLNKLSWMPQLNQIHSSHSTDDETQPPLHYLFRHTKHVTLFEDFICSLIRMDLTHHEVLKKMAYETTASFKFISRVT
jgi:hypothetical protein